MLSRLNPPMEITAEAVREYMPVPHATCPESAPMWIPVETAKAACYDPKGGGDCCKHEVCWSVKEHRVKNTMNWPPPEQTDSAQPPPQPKQGGRKAHVAQGQAAKAARQEQQLPPIPIPPGWPMRGRPPQVLPPGAATQEQQLPPLPPGWSLGGRPPQARQLSDMPDWTLAKTQKRGRGHDQEEEEGEANRLTRQAMEEAPSKFRRSKDRKEQREGVLFDRVMERQDLSVATSNAVAAAYDYANRIGGWRTNLASAALLQHMGMGRVADQDLADAVEALGDAYILRVQDEGSHVAQMQHCCIEAGSGSSSARPAQQYRQQGRSPPRGAPVGQGRYMDLGEEEL